MKQLKTDNIYIPDQKNNIGMVDLVKFLLKNKKRVEVDNNVFDFSNGFGCNGFCTTEYGYYALNPSYITSCRIYTDNDDTGVLSEDKSLTVDIGAGRQFVTTIDFRADLSVQHVRIQESDCKKNSSFPFPYNALSEYSTFKLFNMQQNKKEIKDHLVIKNYKIPINMIDQCKETIGTNNSKDPVTGEQMLQVNQENFIRTFLKKIIKKEEENKKEEEKEEENFIRMFSKKIIKKEDDDQTEEIQEHDNQTEEIQEHDNQTEVIQISIDIENNQIAVLYKKKLYFSDIKPQDQDATIDEAIKKATEIKGLPDENELSEEIKGLPDENELSDENSVNMMNIYLKNGLIYMPYEQIQLEAGARDVAESGRLRIVSPEHKEVISTIQFPTKHDNNILNAPGVNCCFICFNDKKNNFVDMSYDLSTTEYDKILKVYFDKCLLKVQNESNQKLQSGLNNEYNNENMNINNSNSESNNLDDNNKKKI